VVLGVPHDIVYPVIPHVLQTFARDYPKVKVTLLSSFTRVLKAQFSRGECDIILTTEDELDQGGEVIAEQPLIWVGAPGGVAWKTRPLRLAFEHNCGFRQGVQAALDRAGIPWTMAIEGDNSRSIEAGVSADLAVHTVLAGSEPPHVERVAHGGALPELGQLKVGLYVAQPAHGPSVAAMAALIRRAYAAHTGKGDRLMAVPVPLALRAKPDPVTSY
jgi:DNA-binding transcriptional LysR family regulator